MKLQDIKVRVEGGVAGDLGADPAAATGVAQAIMHELATHLGALAQTGATEVIDLKSLPLTAGDLAELEQELGHGEVTATVTAAGPTEIFETQYPGVWWIRYQNMEGKTVTEHLEVTRIPAILMTHNDDVAASAERLAATLESRSTATQ
jgi:hydrogenase-1 operon protein HyaF